MKELRRRFLHEGQVRARQLLLDLDGPFNANDAARATHQWETYVALLRGLVAQFPNQLLPAQRRNQMLGNPGANPLKRPRLNRPLRGLSGPPNP